MLVNVLYPGEQDAGQQKQQSPLDPQITQKLSGNERSGWKGRQSHQPEGEKEKPHRKTDDPHRGPAVSQGLIPGGELGASRGEAYGGKGHDHRHDRHHQLIKSHDLCSHRSGEEDLEEKPGPLGKQAYQGEDHGTLEPGHSAQAKPPFGITLCPMVCPI